MIYKTHKHSNFALVPTKIKTLFADLYLFVTQSDVIVLGIDYEVNSETWVVEYVYKEDLEKDWEGFKASFGSGSINREEEYEEEEEYDEG